MQVQTPKYLSYLSLSLHVNSPPLWSKVIFTSCGEYNHSLITHLPVSLFLLTKSCLCFQPVDNITSLWIQLNFRQSNTLNYLVVHLPSATSPCPWSLLQPQWDSLRKMILKCPCYFMLKSLQRVQCFRIFRYISPFACNHPSFFKNSTDSSQCSIYPSRLHTHTLLSSRPGYILQLWALMVPSTSFIVPSLQSCTGNLLSQLPRTFHGGKDCLDCTLLCCSPSDSFIELVQWLTHDKMLSSSV